MKNKLFIKLAMMSTFLPLVISGCSTENILGPNDYPGINEQTLIPGPQGEQGQAGQDGKDGVSVVSISKTNTDGNVDTYTIAYSDGSTSTFTVTNGVDGEQGIQGNPGQDGHSPVVRIGNNGHWFVDGVDTGIQAQGPKGDKGETGDDGLTPYIGNNGNWWIGTIDTGVKAAGENGQDGSDGEDGISIVSVIKIGSEDNVDTYRIIFSNGTYFDYTVTNGVDGVQGTPGEKGSDGSSVLTGHGAPNSDIGTNGDSYIDLDTWNYYVKSSDNWELCGNINGNAGSNGQDGTDGVSIVSTHIDDDGDLIITLSNGDVINAGHVVDTSLHTVKFYCDDLLVDTQIVKHGTKVSKPEIEDFEVKHWYIDKTFEYEWYWYGCVVTENMSLYGDYTVISKDISFDKTHDISIDEYGYGEAVSSNKEICVSKGNQTSDYLTTLEDRGILFNKTDIGLINNLTIDIDNSGFSSAKLYYGNTPLSFEHSIDLTSGFNDVDLSKAEYFTIQNTGTDPMSIKMLSINYDTKTLFDNSDLPTIIINTKDSQAITSRTEYVNCTVSTNGADNDVSNLKAQIKLRGNSTANCPKKPYRIKLDKKNSLFGYDKAKNWSLLAEYMDGSNMHNYTALKFAKMVREENSFGVNPLHVNVTLNDEHIGIYTFGEHIDAKEGRLDIEQNNIWEKSFNEINFYIERDLSTAYDPTETEGTTYFEVPLENYTLSHYYFSLKYPEKEDFEEELDDGTINLHEEEFQTFFNSLKNYMTNICNKFVDYYHNKDEFSNVAEVVDMASLALYAVTDQAFGETDHNQKSFKMYRENGGLLKFGPNWDYDSCAYSLPYEGTYILNPFTVGGSYNRISFGEKWGNLLFNDASNGKPLFKTIWDNISSEELDTFINSQLQEMTAISFSSIYDCERWMYNQYYSLFDNQLYYWRFVSNQLPYLKGYYS